MACSWHLQGLPDLQTVGPKLRPPWQCVLLSPQCSSRLGPSGWGTGQGVRGERGEDNSSQSQNAAGS